MYDSWYDEPDLTFLSAVYFVIDRNVLNAPLVLSFFSGYAVDVLCRTLKELWLLVFGVFRTSTIMMIGGFLSQLFDSWHFTLLRVKTRSENEIETADMFM